MLRHHQYRSKNQNIICHCTTTAQTYSTHVKRLNPAMTTFSVSFSHPALHWQALGVVGLGLTLYALCKCGCLRFFGSGKVAQPVRITSSSMERATILEVSLLPFFAFMIVSNLITLIFRKVWHQILRKVHTYLMRISRGPEHSVRKITIFLGWCLRYYK